MGSEFFLGFSLDFYFYLINIVSCETVFVKIIFIKTIFQAVILM